MKNIHVLPTENYKQDYTTQIGEVIKVVRLGQLILNKETNQLSVNKSTQWAASCDTDVLVPHHMYITSSDKEVTKDEWWIDTKDNLVFKVTDEDILVIKEDGLPQGFFKIILTTDQDLIKDGVQPIGDKLLEWFIKNTGCETVEIDRDEREVGNHLGGVVTEYGDYKIIITEEEPKSYIKYTNTDDFTSMIYNPQEKLKQSVQEYEQQGLEKYSYELETETRTMKEQTLEEFINSQPYYGHGTPEYLEGIEVGAKWQSERMYGEEEVIDLLIKMNSWPTIFEGKEDITEWFEQSKNKNNGN